MGNIEKEIIDKDNTFWSIIKKTKIRTRFVKGTAIAIWTKGGFISGDFHDRIYFLEVEKQDKEKLKHILDKNQISYTEKEPSSERPLVLISERKGLEIVRKNGLPVMPLKDLVKWAEKLHLESALESLDKMYDLGLGVEYSEVEVD